MEIMCYILDVRREFRIEMGKDMGFGGDPRRWRWSVFRWDCFGREGFGFDCFEEFGTFGLANCFWDGFRHFLDIFAWDMMVR